MPATVIKVAILELYPTSKGKALHPGAEHAKIALLSGNTHGNYSTRTIVNAVAGTLTASQRRHVVKGKAKVSNHQASATRTRTDTGTCRAGSVPAACKRATAVRSGYARIAAGVLSGGSNTATKKSASSSLHLPPLGSRTTNHVEATARPQSSSFAVDCTAAVAELPSKEVNNKQPRSTPNSSTNVIARSAAESDSASTNAISSKNAEANKERAAVTVSVDLISAAHVGKPGWLAEQGFQCIVIPGGSAEKQYSCLGAAGAASLREFVAGGCGYVGICAGAYLALSEWRPKRSLALLRGSALLDWERGQRRVRVHFTALGQQTLFEGCENGVDASNEEDNGDGSSRTEASRSCGVRHGSPRSVNSSSSSIAVGISDYSSSSSSSIVTNTTGDRVVVDSDLIVRYNQGPCILLPTLSNTLESPVDSTTAASGNSETRYNEGKGDVNGSTTRCTLSTSEASNGSLYDPPAGVPSALAVYAEGVDDAVDEEGPTDEEPPKTPCLASVSSSSSSSSGTAAAVSGMCGAGRVVLLSPHFESTTTVACSLDRSWNSTTMDPQCQVIVRAAVLWAARE